MLYYLLSFWKLIQQYTKYSSHFPICIKNCLPQNNHPSKPPKLQGQTFSLDTKCRLKDSG